MNESGKIHRPTSAPDQFDLLENIFECFASCSSSLRSADRAVMIGLF
jgi:hypothetical protein